MQQKAQKQIKNIIESERRKKDGNKQPIKKKNKREMLLKRR